MATIATTFVESVALLLLTALLTGFGVPYVLKGVEYRKAMRQKDHEADLARQAKLIDAQGKFLDDISALLWRWRYLVMRVAYYGGRGIDKRYEEASREYDESLWEVLSALRLEISRSRRLVSEDVYRVLLQVYAEEMVGLDRELGRAQQEERPLDRRTALIELNRRVYHELTDRIDEILAQVATEVGLSTMAGRATAATQGGR